MPHVLALDQGTTSSRAIVFDRHGRACATAQQEFPQHYPQPGWVEHDPRDLWTTTRRTALQAVKKAGLAGRDIAAISRPVSRACFTACTAVRRVVVHRSCGSCSTQPGCG